LIEFIEAVSKLLEDPHLTPFWNECLNSQPQYVAIRGQDGPQLANHVNGSPDSIPMGRSAVEAVNQVRGTTPGN
jgi:hypothetical protein